MAAQDPRLANLLKWSIQNSTPSDADKNAGHSSSGNNDGPYGQKQDGSLPPASEDAQVHLPTPSQPTRTPDPAALQALLLNTPSDAELMKAAMRVATANTTSHSSSATASTNPGTGTRMDTETGGALSSVSVTDKVAALDDLEQLIEGVDNANNLGPLGLWSPLVGLLAPGNEPEIRRMAAWCVGTAVQNNLQAQERAVVAGAVERLVEIVRDGADAVDGAEKSAAEVVAAPSTVTPLRKKARFAISSLVRNYQAGLDAVLREYKARGGKGVAEADAADMESVDAFLNQLVPLQ